MDGKRNHDGLLKNLSEALSRTMRGTARFLRDLIQLWRERRKAFLLWIGASALLLVLFVVAGFLWVARDLPQLAKLADYRPPLPTILYDASGREVTRFYTENRVIIRLDQVPRTVVNAVIAIEDASFYRHHGIDFIGIIRAMAKNLMAVKVVQGGSTITQQLAKSLLLTSERTLTRKMKEAILAWRMEKNFTKEEILEVYLNQIYFGYGSYGIETAAINHFGRHVWELALPEAALLAGLPKAPTAYSPFRDPEAAVSRRNHVLRRMLEEGFITPEELAAAEAAPLGLNPRQPSSDDPNASFTEEVRRYIYEKYGEEALYRGGLSLIVTIDQAFQKFALEAVRAGLRELDKRQGYRGPLETVLPEKMGETLKLLALENGLARIASLENTAPGSGGLAAYLAAGPASGQPFKALVTAVAAEGISLDLGGIPGFITAAEVEWTKNTGSEETFSRSALEILKPGSVILVRNLSTSSSGADLFTLEQEPQVQGALVCMDAGSGRVLAMVGGEDFRKSQFNRATQARRQPGSAFKPIVYSAAMDNGFTPSSVVVDSPIIFDDPNLPEKWKPSNYEEKFYGPTTLRNALTMSRNVVTVKVAQVLGVETIVQYAARFGFTRDLPQDLSLALGSLGVSPLELTAAYSAFANPGYRTVPWMVEKVTDRDGNVLETFSPVRIKVLEEDTAYIMQNLLRGVVQSGTGWRAKAIGRPSAGKTGTTNELMDAWYMGFIPGMVTGVWVGFDQKTSMRGEETGSRAAAPIWVNFMQKAVEGLPITPFPPPPPGVEMVKVEPKSGLLARPGSGDFIFECFKAGTVPREYAREQGRKPGEQAGGEHSGPEELPGILPRDY